MKTLVLLALCAVVHAEPHAWQPAPGHTHMKLWPGVAPDLRPMPRPESQSQEEKASVAKHWTAVTNVSVPTLTVYAPTTKSTGAAVVVIPGGGFEVLAMDLEGTEVCDWLTSTGVTCVLLEYRVPSAPYDWRTDSRPDNLCTPTQSLEDTQRAMGLVRAHADEWGIDPHAVGVIGFSAGGYLAAEISTRWKRRLYAPVDDADRQSARPDFAIAI
jgi:acetyl esterase/lipase